MCNNRSDSPDGIAANHKYRYTVAATNTVVTSTQRPKLCVSLVVAQLGNWHRKHTLHFIRIQFQLVASIIFDLRYDRPINENQQMMNNESEK